MKQYPFDPNVVLVSGHRGERCFGLENTLCAFRRVLELGVDMIETDVRMTADGRLILMHDERVDRTTNGSGRVRDLTWAEIQKLDATVNSTVPVSPESPPLFSDLLDLVKAYPKVLLNIELKDYPQDDEAFAFQCADKICGMLIDHGLADRTWINSFSGKLLEYVYKKHDSVFYYHGFYPWFILGDMTIDPESFIDVACMQHRVQYENGVIEKCPDPLCPREWFEYLLDKGIMPLSAPSLQEYPRFDAAVSYGSRMINSDEPERMLAHLRQMGMHP